MPNDPFYKSREYKAWCDAVFSAAEKDELGRPLCEECLKYGRRTPATVAHHRIPVKVRPDLALVRSNGAPLCARCHNVKHPEKGTARKHPPLHRKHVSE